MANENEGFRVNDRRHSAAGSAGGGGNAGEAKAGEGFVMKEGDDTPSAPEQLDFATLVMSFATGAMIHLGLVPEPGTGKTQKNLALARQNIDILEILQKKTRGNLSNEEDRMLESLLAETRLRFVEASR